MRQDTPQCTLEGQWAKRSRSQAASGWDMGSSMAARMLHSAWRALRKPGMAEQTLGWASTQRLATEESVVGEIINIGPMRDDVPDFLPQTWLPCRPATDTAGMSDADALATLALNVTALMRLTRAALPGMR